MLDNARVRAHTSKGKTRFISEPGLPNLYCHRRRHHNNNLRCAWQSSQQYILCRGRVFSVQGCGSAHTFWNFYTGAEERVQRMKLQKNISISFKTFTAYHKKTSTPIAI
jgi:hypothetical protein